MYYRKLQYWYKKYVPEALKALIFNIVFLPFNIFEGLKIINFQRTIKNSAPLAQLSWSTSNISSIFKNNDQFLKRMILYINECMEFNLEYDKQIESDSSRQYEFEYLNFNNFPGEHYRLLAAMCRVENFENIVEIGTGSGIACKIFLEHSNAQINTVDIVPWNQNNSHLTKSEFNNPRLNQIIQDFSEEKSFQEYKKTFVNSDLLFLDAGKDGVFEKSFLQKISNCEFDKKFRLLMIDDIKYFTMQPIWEKIKSPKIDFSSFGHWSGTGIVDISEGLIFDE